MAEVKYLYDYPENRMISRGFRFAEFVAIQKATGYSLNYIRKWCYGIRRNEKIMEAAKKMQQVVELRESILNDLN